MNGQSSEWHQSHPVGALPLETVSRSSTEMFSGFSWGNAQLNFSDWESVTLICREFPEPACREIILGSACFCVWRPTRFSPNIYIWTALWNT